MIVRGFVRQLENVKPETFFCHLNECLSLKKSQSVRIIDSGRKRERDGEREEREGEKRDREREGAKR